MPTLSSHLGKLLHNEAEPLSSGSAKDGQKESTHEFKPSSSSSSSYRSQFLNVPRLSRFLKNFVPLLMFVGIGYLEFCYCFKLCYQELYFRGLGKACGITFFVIFEVFLLIMFILWAQLVFIGPGKLDIKIPPYDLSRFLNQNGAVFDLNQHNLIDPPDWFICDSDGLPFWCLHCQSIKMFRSHHSSETGECVPRFDHYCIYIRSVIGVKNYKLFIQLLAVIFAWFTFIVVSTACFAPLIRDYRSVLDTLILNPNLIVMFIITIFWMIMTGALLLGHLILIKKNMTTVESMQLDRRRTNSDIKRFINFKHPWDPSKRIVMQIEPKQLLYDSGFYNNICDLLGTRGWNLLSPFNTNCSDIAQSPRSIFIKNGPKGLIDLESDSFSKDFKKSILKRLENGEGCEFGKFPVTNNNT